MIDRLVDSTGAQGSRPLPQAAPRYGPGVRCLGAERGAGLSLDGYVFVTTLVAAVVFAVTA